MPKWNDYRHDFRYTATVAVPRNESILSILMDKSFDKSLNLTFHERIENRAEVMEAVDDFVAEMVMWCDDKEDLLSLGSILLVTAKNVMTTAMDLEAWKMATTEYVKSVGTENEISRRAIKRQKW
jgi:hypothetical protein